ncbi:Cys-rich peptide radical SAM maturase CcpM [Paenibacillus monticola]|uniref:Cys-rich peptide radical SAM maturase CcpM n=1 Tax=Paenibacillus monticola TaxID=2666075 RepID=A0A7X2H9E5_9BACL|nr:Cys-rich peptide radical SAM maturase CcpM [Paenibacillus monticola]MRN55835.1 Cys-rich peptide radical SAM maturase CcpM [Paenibacillus monticola]
MLTEIKPLIHTFKNMSQFYFFDVNKNKIINIDEETYRALNDPDPTLIEGIPVIRKLQSQGYLSVNRAQEIKHANGEILEELLGYNLKKIILQVTQNCNFRCNYCVYSGSYVNRVHNNKRMDFAVARKGIDFLIAHSKDAQEIDIGFYGGEPLLEIDLIIQCMDYAIQVAEGKNVSFSLTTNGSLLNETNAKKLLGYNLRITVSLDGPQEVHDKNRTFASNGCGTFNTVYNNIKRIVQKYPSIKQNLSFSMVIDPTAQFSCLDEFIGSEEEFFNESSVIGSFISNAYRNEEVRFSENFIGEWEYSRFKYLLFVLGKVSKANNSQLIRSSYREHFDYVSKSHRNIAPIAKADHHSGPCVPGQIRLFMSTDAFFYPCERVSETSDIMRIGSIEEGFYFDKIEELLNVGKLTEDNCKDCFAFRNCKICASLSDDGTKLSRETKLKACQDVRYNLEEVLKDVVTLKECGLKKEMIQKAMS